MERRRELVSALAGEAHLWLTQVGSDIEQSVLSSWWELLSEEESERHDAFLLEEARLQYLAAWALARTTLSRYADIEPRDWRFQRGKHGRPEIVRPDCAAAAGEHVAPPTADSLPKASMPAAAVPRLRFNLSHGTGLVACLVTLEVDVGVDVESTQRDLDMARLADRFFSPEEASIGAKGSSRIGPSRRPTSRRAGEACRFHCGRYPSGSRGTLPSGCNSTRRSRIVKAIGSLRFCGHCGIISWRRQSGAARARVAQMAPTCPSLRARWCRWLKRQV